jgi:hypothetical protein
LIDLISRIPSDIDSIIGAGAATAGLSYPQAAIDEPMDLEAI